MNHDLKRELERRVADSEIPPLPLNDIKERGRRLLWRRRAAFAASCVMGVLVLVVAAVVFIDGDQPASTRSAAPPTTEGSDGSPERDPVVSLEPDRVRAGDSADLQVHPSPGVYGLEWTLEREEGSSWEWAGYLKAGPGKRWEGEFFLPPLSGGDIEDIGFTGPAVMALEIPELEPGIYRLGQDFFRKGRGSQEVRIQWHYAEFEVLEPDQQAPPPTVQEDDAPGAVSLDPNRARVGDRAKLRVNRSRGIWGVGWRLEQHDGSAWRAIGLLVAGPRKPWEPKFYLGPDWTSIGVDDIGFRGSESMALEIPELEPGIYRLGQDFFRKGRGSQEDRIQWHYAEFEVLE